MRFSSSIIVRDLVLRVRCQLHPFRHKIAHLAPSEPVLIRNNDIYPSFYLACLREHPPRPEPKKGARPSAEVVKQQRPAQFCLYRPRAREPRPYGWYLGFLEL